jgi:hypothetical protein
LKPGAFKLGVNRMKRAQPHRGDELLHFALDLLSRRALLLVVAVQYVAFESKL